MRSRTRMRAAIEGLENRLVLSTYVVNTFVDQIDPPGSNTVSIRDALAMVAADSSNDTINDTIDVPAGDYKLALGALVINSYQSVTIQSTGGLATIDAQSLSANVIDAIQFGPVSLSGLVITGASGQASSVGLTPSAAVEYASDNMNVTDCVITDNAGVAMHSSYVYATTDLSGVTISNNAGGLECGGGNRLDVSNSTITGNTSTAVQCPTFVGIYDSTIVDNSGPGVITNGQATIANSIIAGNGEDFEGYVASFGGNVIGNIGTSTGWGGLDKFGSAALPLGSLLLAPLGNYGGPTPTMPPLEGSPALLAAFTATIAADSTDQRGLPRIVNGAVDSGAVETQKPPSIRLTAAPSQVFTESGTVMPGAFSAPGINGPFAVVIGWGDGSPDTVLNMNAAGAIPPQFHSFPQASLFRVTVGVIDVASDLSNAASFNATVVGAGTPTSIVVNTDNDQTDPSSSQTVSLRDAIAKADQATGPVHIAFSPEIFATPQTLTLSGAPLNIGGAPFAPLTITGPTAGLTIDIGAAKTLTIQSDANVAFNGINFSGTAPKPDFDNISNAGILTITHSTISGLLDGVINNGALALHHTVISGSDNGAITNNGGMILNDSTVSGNTNYDSGIYNNGVAFIYDCTIIANNRDGIENTGRALVTSCTITGNYSAGIDNVGNTLFSNGAGTVTLSNSIIANNATAYASSGYFGDIVGAVNSLGHNLIGEVDGRSGWISSDLTGTVAVPLDPKLSPLGYYGGSTQTQFPFPDSPALGAGSAALVPAGVTTDQRGFTRIIDGKVDIGACQSQPPSSFAINPPAAQSAGAGTAKTFTLGSFSDPGASGPFVVTVFWDDGASVSTFNLSGAGPLGTLRHVFNATGTIFNTIVVADRARNVALGAFIVHSSPRA
ncbi:MAG TPA: right-handed parallel beta-helix repeat-containing protein, partial [Humisphaera sp.]|nr:right-handed parallel beta-helix repeat-containing protein [Humisphaera sp.]